MSDAPDQQPAPTSAETQNTDTTREHMIPKSRFDEVNGKLQKLEREAAQREAAERQRAEQEAAQRGEWEKLAGERGAKLQSLETEHGARGERVAALETAMEAQIKARIKALPEELRDLLIDGDVLSRYEQLGKLEAAAAKLMPGTPPAPRGTNTGPRGGNTAASSGANHDLVAEHRARMGGL